MADYDYKQGKKRIKDILDNKLMVVEQNKLPAVDKLTFDNAYKSWVSAIFVDIRDSTSLFTEEDKEKVSKIIRSFTSEIIEILRKDDNLREIGIRGIVFMQSIRHLFNRILMNALTKQYMSIPT